MRPDTQPPLQYRCGMCGAAYLTTLGLARHKAGELEAFKAWAHAKRMAYVESRREWRETHGIAESAGRSILAK